MPLQNRVSPFGELFATRARGMLMGNRGGRLHDDGRHLASRRWTSKQWICCKLEFNDRHREVWGKGYTELFFLDEVTAFAAGHRPCFECRRNDAERFATLFSGARKRASAAAMDQTLHEERLIGKIKRAHARKFDTLPDGAMIAFGYEAFAVRGKRLLRWTPTGYRESIPRPRGVEADVLTPPSILAVLRRGFRPMWHPGANNL
ncbi:MAG TPA: hypothetical protein VKG24_33020 [Pseudolabrys sp.]|nr:hypothetical protein [Pseudolabrys sp.]